MTPLKHKPESVVGIDPALIVQPEILTDDAIFRTWTGTTATFRIALYTNVSGNVRIVVQGALVLALFAFLEIGAFLANQLVETVAGAFFASGMAFSTDGLAAETFQRRVLVDLWPEPLEIVTVRTGVVVEQANVHGGVLVHYCQLARSATARTYGVFRSATPEI